jgi:hypothetical protein
MRPTLLACALSLAACGTSSARPPAVQPAPPDALVADAPVADAPVADALVADAPAPDASAPADVGPPSDAACATCVDYALDPARGRVASASLGEISGLVESRRRRGVFFVHNDSGDSARFFAVDERGALLAEYRLRGAPSVDWEDIAAGPCGADVCLFLADVGDNDMVRAGYTVLRVREPAVVPDVAPATVTPVELPWEALAFRYPDGSHNAEALVAHPATGDLYVITKTDGDSAVYRLPASAPADATTTLTRVATLDLPPSGAALVTGADLHPCASRLLVRTYVRLFEYELPPGRPFEAIFTVAPREVPVLAERQGEAVGWRADGRGYVTVSEGANPTLNRFGCANP